MTITTAKRKTAARKPARSRAAVNGANGQPAVRPPDQNGQPAVRPPEEFVPREPVTEIPASGVPEPERPYGGKQVQVFVPMADQTAAEIVVPHISNLEITEEFLWENHKQNLDLMQQSWRWMDLAGIPDEVQRQIVRLPPADKRRFWEEWFAGFVPPPSGEPPGES